jgi:hypothetical protein
MTKCEAAQLIASRDPSDYEIGRKYFGKPMCESIDCSECYDCGFPDNPRAHVKEARLWLEAHPEPKE